MKSEKPRRFINCYVSTQACNFKCDYCYIGQRKIFDNEMFTCKYPVEVMRKATSIERLGGVCIFNLCAGGETLLGAHIIPVIQMLLENGHNVSIVTNGTISDTIEKILAFPRQLLEKLYFKFSFHYFELKKKNLTDIFFANVSKVKNEKVSFSIDITPCDELIPYIDEIKGIFDKYMNGAMPHISVARDTTSRELKILSKYDKEEYKKIWSVFDSPKFDYKIEEFLKPHREYCYAGNWSFSLELSTGNCRICDGAPEPGKMDFYNLYENPDEEIPFVEIGCNCPTAHCYNCHALLTLGTIPELETPTYAEMLDRVDAEGNHWLTEEMREFYSYRVGDSNIG